MPPKSTDDPIGPEIIETTASSSGPIGAEAATETSRRRSCPARREIPQSGRACPGGMRLQTSLRNVTRAGLRCRRALLGRRGNSPCRCSRLRQQV
jgi:hypothetical protein